MVAPFGFEIIDTAVGGGGGAIGIGGLLYLLHKLGVVKVQPQGKNGNGAAGFDHKQCLTLHKKIDLNIKGLQDGLKTHESRLDDFADDLKDIKGEVIETGKGMAVLLDRSKQRRSEDRA